MKIAISTYGKGLDSEINPRFGRCDFFVIVDTEDNHVESSANENRDLGGGAGIQTAGFLVSKGVTAVITGSCGPNAMDVFKSANVDVFTGQAGLARQAVDRLTRGELVASGRANAVQKAGMGNTGPSNVESANDQVSGCRARGGQGMGMGRGGGRGMGSGMGRRGGK